MVTWEWEVCGVRVVGEAAVDVCWDKGPDYPSFVLSWFATAGLSVVSCAATSRLQNSIHSGREKKAFRHTTLRTLQQRNFLRITIPFLYIHLSRIIYPCKHLPPQCQNPICKPFSTLIPVHRPTQPIADQESWPPTHCGCSQHRPRKRASSSSAVWQQLRRLGCWPQGRRGC